MTDDRLRSYGVLLLRLCLSRRLSAEVALKGRARWNQFLDIDSQSIIISAVAYKAACAPTKDGRRPMLLS
jgi:hypothetical protein